MHTTYYKQQVPNGPFSLYNVSVNMHCVQCRCSIDHNFLMKLKTEDYLFVYCINNLGLCLETVSYMQDVYLFGI